MPVLTDFAHPAGLLRDRVQPCLDVGEVVLRPWRADDAPAVLAAFDCPDIQHWHVRRIDSTDEALAWIDGWAAAWSADSDASWAITSRDEVLGQVGLRTVCLSESSTRMSYWVMPGARGAGVAVRAARSLARWVFDDLKMHRVYVDHSTANEASCRVALKAGFAVEGTLRGAGLHTDGWHDMHLHSRLRTD